MLPLVIISDSFQIPKRWREKADYGTGKKEKHGKKEKLTATPRTVYTRRAFQFTDKHKAHSSLFLTIFQKHLRHEPNSPIGEREGRMLDVPATYS